MRGNVIDLAVAVVIGAAFGAVVKAFVDRHPHADHRGASSVKPDFSGPGVHGQRTASSGTGSFINALISFLLIAAAIYFVVVMPMNKLAERRAKGGQDPGRPRSAPSA